MMRKYNQDHILNGLKYHIEMFPKIPGYIPLNIGFYEHLIYDGWTWEEIIDIANNNINNMTFKLVNDGYKLNEFGPWFIHYRYHC